MSRLLSSLMAALSVSACAAAVSPDTYNINVNFTPDEDGLMLYMVNYDDGAKIDSALVDNGIATLSGRITDPVMVQLVLDGNRAGSFILEPGKTTVDSNTRSVTSEGKFNSQWNAYSASLAAIAKEYDGVYRSSNPDKESLLKAIESRYNSTSDSMFAANRGNIIGYRLFLDKAYDLSPEEFEAQLVSNPDMGNYTRIKRLRTSKANEAATSEGNLFKDFTIKNGDKVERLSDYVGKGRWTLVDFWASWCGPCIQEIETIKKLYAEHAGKDLDFLGVAVWDEPDNTLKAIEKHQLPWPVIINAQTIPTDLYGIAGIPCIILFDPQGKIVSRGEQGESLIKAVENALASDNQ